MDHEPDLDLDLDDDDALAVYGDSLATTDEARAELIAVQCELARDGIAQVDDLIEAPGEDIARAATLLRRQNVLLAQHRARWTRELLGSTAGHARLELRRGLPVELEIEANLDSIARALGGSALATQAGPPGDGASTSGVPPLGRASTTLQFDGAATTRPRQRGGASTIRTLKLASARLPDLEALVAMPGVAQLRTLMVRFANDQPYGIDDPNPGMAAAWGELDAAIDAWRVRQREAGELDATAETMMRVVAAAPRLEEVRCFGHALDPRALAGLAGLRAYVGGIADRALRHATKVFAAVERLELGIGRLDEGPLDEPLRVLDGRFAKAHTIGLAGFAYGDAAPAFELVLPARLSLAFEVGSAAAVAAIVGSPAMARVEQLELDATAESDAAILDALAANPHLDRLARLRIDGLPNSGALARMRAPRLVSLALKDTALETDALVAVLVAHRGLRVLDVHGMVGVDGDVGDVGGRIAPHVARLRSLGVTYAGLDDAGLAAIVANAPALRRLRIGGNPIGVVPALPPSLVSLDLRDAPFATVRAEHLVELGLSPVADQNARIRLRARFGEGAAATFPHPPSAHALVAVIDGPGSDALFAELRANAATVLDDDTVLDTMGMRVVGRAPGLLKLFHRPADRAAALALAHRAGGALYFEDADDDAAASG